jgi:hypothetical protein
MGADQLLAANLPSLARNACRDDHWGSWNSPGPAVIPAGAPAPAGPVEAEAEAARVPLRTR